MSLRQMFQGSIVKPGFNPLVQGTPSYTYNLYAWGDGTSGVLGLGNTNYWSSPKQVGALTNWVALASNYKKSSYAITTSGTLLSWGGNPEGQLGLGNTTNYSSPKQVGALTNWLKISSGSYSACVAAIKTDGTIWTWGKGNSGALGLGDNASRSSPTQVGALTNWLNVTTGYSYMLATKTDGTLWAWGSNALGNLGLGNTTTYNSPKQVGALTNWLKVSASNYFSMAIKTDGTLWSWGSGSNGKLGLGNSTNYYSPKAVGSLTNWSNVVAGGTFTLASKTDGTLWAWGVNTYGQLGLGNTTTYNSPKQIGSLTNWSTVSAGGFSFALSAKTDGTLWSWGINSFGQLGLGNTTTYSSPIQVGALTNWSVVSAGYRSSLALAY
jgi:alpha-tubulin suppressor-like RCC1 family protein